MFTKGGAILFIVGSLLLFGGGGSNIVNHYNTAREHTHGVGGTFRRYKPSFFSVILIIE